MKKKKSKINKIKTKSKYHLMKLYAEMQRIYLLDIARRHDYSEEHLNKLELKLEQIENIIIDA